MMTNAERQFFELGKFLLSFAIAENHLRQTVAKLGGVSDTFSKVVLSGLRTEDAIAHLRKLLPSSGAGAEVLASYSDVFEHLGPIKDARNLMLHHGIAWYGRGFAATNMPKVLKPEDAVVIPISNDILEQMTQDLFKITAILMNNWLRLDGLSPSLRPDPVELSAWRYTPPPQGGSQKQKGRSGQKDGRKPPCRP